MTVEKIDQNKDSMTLSDVEKELISTQSRLYASQLSYDIYAKLKYVNITSLQHPKVQEILQLDNFKQYSLLQKALGRRNNIIDQQDRTTQDKELYKQILLAKSILSMALRNIGEGDLAHEIGFSKENSELFIKTAKQGKLKDHIFSASYIKCLHAFQQSTQASGGNKIAQRSKVDAILGYRTIQQLLSYANMKVTKPVEITKEYTREYNASNKDFTNREILQNEIDHISRLNPLEHLTLGQCQMILSQLLTISANSTSELVDEFINPYRKQLIDQMLALGATGSDIAFQQNLTNIRSSIDDSLSLNFKQIEEEYRTKYFKNRTFKETISSKDQKNPYLDSPYNPRNFINPGFWKLGDSFFNGTLEITPAEEQKLYQQQGLTTEFAKGVAYVIAKEGILNVPDDIAMLIGDVLALTRATLSTNGLFLKYIGARLTAGKYPESAQDLARLIEAHPLLGMLSAITSRSTVTSILSQVSTLLQGDGTAKNWGDMINMIGGLIMGAGGVLKFGGKVVKLGGKAVRSERIIKAGEGFDQFGKKVINKATVMDPIGAVSTGVAIGVNKISNVVKPKIAAVRRAKKAAMNELKDRSSSQKIDQNTPASPSSSNASKSSARSIDNNASQSRTNSSALIDNISPSHNKIQKLRASIQDSPGKKLSASQIQSLIQYMDDLDLQIKQSFTQQEISIHYHELYQSYNKLHPTDQKILAGKMDQIDKTICKECKTLTSSEIKLINNGLKDLDNTTNAVNVVMKLGKLTDSRWGFEGLMGGAPAWVMRQIPGLNMLPVEAAINLVYAFIQRRYAKKIGMSDSQIRTMLLNQAKDAGISFALSTVIGMTGGGFLGGINPLNWILSAGFGLGDLKFKANVKNAQEFIKFYGQQIEDLKGIATPEQLKIHQAKYDKLVQDLPKKVKEYTNLTQTYNAVGKAKNMSDLKLVIAQRFDQGVKLESGTIMPKKTLLKLITQYEQGGLTDMRQLPEEFGLRDQIIKLHTQQKSSYQPIL